MPDFDDARVRRAVGFRDNPCRCIETSPAPDAFDGIYHWRSDCPYLNDAEKRAVRDCYGEPDEALRRWREQHAAP